jgi:hypothetical protein
MKKIPQALGWLLTLASLAAAAPFASYRAAAAGRSEPAVDEPTGPSSIDIRPTLSPEDKARQAGRIEEYRQKVRGRLASWAGPYLEAVYPVRHAVDEALRSLAISWGPTTKNTGYAVEIAVARFARSQVFPAPEPMLDAQLQRAVGELNAGAAACSRGLPTTAQLHFLAGKRWLDRAGRTLSGFRQPLPAPAPGGMKGKRRDLEP